MLSTNCEFRLFSNWISLLWLPLISGYYLTQKIAVTACLNETQSNGTIRNDSRYVSFLVPLARDFTCLWAPFQASRDGDNFLRADKTFHLPHISRTVAGGMGVRKRTKLRGRCARVRIMYVRSACAIFVVLFWLRGGWRCVMTGITELMLARGKCRTSNRCFRANGTLILHIFKR